MALFDSVRGLELEVGSFSTERRELPVSTGFVRVTTTVVLEGGGQSGSGEDVTYSAEAHDDFPAVAERGRMTFEEFSARLEPYGFCLLYTSPSPRD